MEFSCNTNDKLCIGIFHLSRWKVHVCAANCLYYLQDRKAVCANLAGVKIDLDFPLVTAGKGHLRNTAYF